MGWDTRKLEVEKNNMFSQLDKIDIDKIESEGITFRVGNKILKLETVEIQDNYSIEQEIKNEIRKKLSNNLQQIKEKINTKLSEMNNFVQQIKYEYERKEHELDEKLKNANPMPNIFYEHAEKGLSVIKGNDSDELIWLLQGIYWPKYYGKNIIESKFSKKMITNIIIMIKTKKDKVVGVTTRQPHNKLEYFSHYHQSKPDCWGSWKYNKDWKTPEDILKIGKEAEVVLEYINGNSLAIRSPTGLPKIETIKRHLISPSLNSEYKDIKLNNATNAGRMGVTNENNVDEYDMWST